MAKPGLCTLVFCLRVGWCAVGVENGSACARVPEEEFSRHLSLVAGVYGRHGWSSGDSTVAVSTLLNFPRSIALDADNQRLFLADSGSHVVRVVDLATGAIPVIAGAVGQCGSDGDGGLAAAARLCGPHGVAWDSTAQSLYVADSQNHVVRRLQLPLGAIGADRVHVGENGNYVDSGMISTVVGILGSRGHSGDGSPPDRAQLNFPTNVAIDAVRRRLFVADRENHVVRLVELSLGVITTLAGVPGVPGNGGDGGSTAAHLSFPAGIVANSELGLYIADYGNHAVRHVNVETGVISTVAGVQGLPGSPGDGARDGPEARLRYPSDVALDAEAQVLYVAGAANPAVRRVDLTTGHVSTALARPGVYSKPERGGPVGLALDSTLQTLFLSETFNHIVRSVNLSTGPTERLSVGCS